ncbi:hypothetical protein [Roseibium album]|uniref:hypothetical protein n=1 Tax=Roseibium album TaxID=311410 RepID=UPI00329974F2
MSTFIEYLSKIEKIGRYSNNLLLDKERIVEINNKFPGISSQYLVFLERFGVIEDPDILDYHLPYLLIEELFDAGYYPYDETTKFDFGDDPRGWRHPPETAIVFAHSGASWLYCFLGDGSDGVYTFDYAGNIFETNNKDFFAHLFGLIDRSSDNFDEDAEIEFASKH